MVDRGAWPGSTASRSSAIARSPPRPSRVIVPLGSSPGSRARPSARRVGGQSLRRRLEDRGGERRVGGRAGSQRRAFRRGSGAARPVRRASGSLAASPCSSSASRYARSSRRIAAARVPSIGAPWPGTTWSACSTSGSSRASVARYARPAPWRAASGSRPATGSRRTPARAPTGSRPPCRPGVAVGRLQLQLAIADLELPRHRQPLGARQRERPRALDVVLLVELAQGALGGAGLVDQPPGGRVASSRAAPPGTRSGRAGGPSRRAWRAGRRR